jgi:hypothetical protein
MGSGWTSLYARHHVCKDQPTLGGAAESSLVARVKVGLSDFLLCSFFALGSCKHVCPSAAPAEVISTTWIRAPLFKTEH